MKRILVSGASGLIGSALCTSLGRQGVQVIRLVRKEQQAGGSTVLWNPAVDNSIEDLRSLEGCDAVVHLAGANLAGHRWTAEYRRVILDSRVNSTNALLRALQQLRNGPKTLIGASATGIYGDRGDEVMTEGSSAGEGFLPEVCRRWEDATGTARQLGMRVVQLRFGVVLARQGGALKTMLPVFRAGLGGKLGSGRQFMSWLSLPDAVRVIEFALEDGETSGPYNAITPDPVRNVEWTETLARMLHRPAFLRVPAFALRAAFGQMAQDTMLASTRAMPARLEAAGFRFAHERLQTALAAIL